MMISINIKKATDKIQLTFMTKTLSKLRIKKEFLKKLPQIHKCYAQIIYSLHHL